MASAATGTLRHLNFSLTMRLKSRGNYFPPRLVLLIIRPRHTIAPFFRLWILELGWVLPRNGYSVAPGFVVYFWPCTTESLPDVRLRPFLGPAGLPNIDPELEIMDRPIRSFRTGVAVFSQRRKKGLRLLPSLLFLAWTD